MTQGVFKEKTAKKKWMIFLKQNAPGTLEMFAFGTTDHSMPRSAANDSCP